MPKHLTESVAASITANYEFTTGTCEISSGATFVSYGDLTIDGGNVTIDDGDLTLQSSSTTTLFMDASDSSLALGTDGAARGFLRLYGKGAGQVQGGTVYMHTSNDYDTTIDYFLLMAYEDDLYLGTSGDIDAVKLDSNKDLHVTAGCVYITTASAGVTVGSSQVLTARQTGVSAMSNVSAPSNVDADTVSTAELADIVGTLIDKLRTHGLIGD